MKRKQRDKRNNIPTLDLHNVRFSGYFDMHSEITLMLDRFLSPFLLQNHRGIEVRVVVGRGLNSKNLIQGKNPMRYYTEEYLNQLGLRWRNGGYFDGQDGVIVVSV
jgi:hypothetical protein